MNVQLVADIFILGLLPVASLVLCLLSIPGFYERVQCWSPSSPLAYGLLILVLGMVYITGMVVYSLTLLPLRSRVLRALRRLVLLFRRRDDEGEEGWATGYRRGVYVVQFGSADLIRAVFYGGAIPNVLKSLIGFAPIFVCSLCCFLWRRDVLDGWVALVVGITLGGLLFVFMWGLAFTRFMDEQKKRIKEAESVLRSERRQPGEGQRLARACAA